MELPNIWHPCSLLLWMLLKLYWMLGDTGTGIGMGHPVSSISQPLFPTARAGSCHWAAMSFAGTQIHKQLLFQVPSVPASAGGSQQGFHLSWGTRLTKIWSNPQINCPGTGKFRMVTENGQCSLRKDVAIWKINVLLFPLKAMSGEQICMTVITNKGTPRYRLLLQSHKNQLV